ncbi:type 1 glutamine amidotransferase [Altererythrobacter sp. KTW20L]|uniref:type 1 glutamine amidotransferase domain-containing protein n=1 Tax=Altererythrobacter sp. KTW20L TaxID=2942210 RepID=UPI0020BF4881|nr:type 1 glutamine amidotransferase domain-containing protein [Altererythrobacter sp. KTW20L]MCL6249562.1 type 1 glutamine amidotransferase [Altererythrobacter sp. KTW20L]
MSKPVMILATNGFEQSELEQPVKRLNDAGFKTLVVSPEEGEIRGWDGGDWGNTVKVDRALSDAQAADYAALVLPGGQINPDILRMEDKAVQLVRDFCEAGKPVAAICHGPWLLAEADVIDGKRVTSWPSIRTDLANAGAEVEDAEVVTDGNLITSRNPTDIPAFCDALISALNDAARMDDAA